MHYSRVDPPCSERTGKEDIVKGESEEEEAEFQEKGRQIDEGEAAGTEARFQE